MIDHNLTTDNFPTLSIQQIVDCSGVGCNGGFPEDAFKYIIQCGGLESSIDYPTTVPGTCRFDRTKVAACISSYKKQQYTSEVQMQTDVFTMGPMVASVDASTWQLYLGGVIAAAQCGTSIDHSVQVVGYNVENTPPFWSLKNSWSRVWGEQGFIRIEFGKKACGVTEEVLTATPKESCF